MRSLHVVVVKLLAFLSRGCEIDPGLLVYWMRLNRGPMKIFQDKFLTRTDCDKAGDYVVPNVLSPRNLVFRPDIGHKLYHNQVIVYKMN